MYDIGRKTAHDTYLEDGMVRVINVAENIRRALLQIVHDLGEVIKGMIGDVGVNPGCILMRVDRGAVDRLLRIMSTELFLGVEVAVCHLKLSVGLLLIRLIEAKEKGGIDDRHLNRPDGEHDLYQAETGARMTFNLSPAEKINPGRKTGDTRGGTLQRVQYHLIHGHLLLQTDRPTR